MGRAGKDVASLEVSRGLD